MKVTTCETQYSHIPRIIEIRYTIWHHAMIRNTSKLGEEEERIRSGYNLAIIKMIECFSMTTPLPLVHASHGTCYWAFIFWASWAFLKA